MLEAGTSSGRSGIRRSRPARSAPRRIDAGVVHPSHAGGAASPCRQCPPAPLAGSLPAAGGLVDTLTPTARPILMATFTVTLMSSGAPHSLMKASRGVYGEAAGEWTAEDARGYSRMLALPGVFWSRANP